MATVNRCALPAFWKEASIGWFTQIESLFTSNGITDDNQKYNLVVGALDQTTIQELIDIIQAPPNENKYETLKTTTIARTTDSEAVRLQKVLSGMTLGASKPSHLYRKMKAMAGTALSDEALKATWLGLLPSAANMMLRVLPATTTNAMLDSADILVGPTTSISAVGAAVPQATPANITATHSSSSTPATSEDIASLRQAIAQLTSIVRQS